MASGLPVIALRSEGQRDVCEDAGPDRLLPIDPERWEECNEAPFGKCGIRGYLAWSPLPSACVGLEIIARKLERWDGEPVTGPSIIAIFWTAGPAVVDILERHLSPPRALIRSYTVLVPSWQTACGIAEHTRHLCEHIPGAQPAASDLDLKRVRLMHVQHEPSLYAGVDLTLHVHKARAYRVPVVITEHNVQREATAWEREADALVALTESGRQILQERWPKKRVIHIPHGCPEWFPSASGNAAG